jgi:hypothetical protein
MVGHAEKTREIYQAQHELISADVDAFNRINQMYDSTTFGLEADWFKGKTALDAGCGNIGSLIIKLHKLGAAVVTGADISDEWIGSLRENLTREGLPPEAYDLKSGNILDLPFPDESFDFVAINGVLIHLESMSDVEKGFGQGAAKTKVGGYYYTSYGPCGGVMQGVIMPALRAHYRSDAAFKGLIDNIAPDTIHQTIDKIVRDAKQHADQTLDGEFLKSLFGWDYCVFLQNFIQAPTWWSNECTPQYVEKLYADNGFVNVRRLGSYTKRKDIRKYFAPLHYDREHPISKILYGDGYVQYIGQKE